ncbi:MAG: T9SS type A sorting domain-containing protein [Bacteroidales bacterium]|nr:T9SS type A sorting domain-containing protein [Bacteroidales bacterium]
MKRVVFFLTVLAAISGSITAQERYITRGAEEGELYMSVHWYCDYGFWGDTVYDAILHITENGKKVAINHSVESRPPDSGIADSLPMQIYHVIADATPGVLYNVDWCYDTEVYPYTRLWFSDDYGKSWEMRDKNIGQNRYYVSNFEGLMYRGGEWNGISKSSDYANTWTLLHEKGYISRSEPYFKECELFGISGSYPTDPWSLYYTNDCFDTYTVIPIGEEYVYGKIGGWAPNVFRGGLPGEMYVTSGFPNNVFKVSFSADTGYNFRIVYQRDGYRDFMSDRKAGDFYIVSQRTIATEQPWGWYTRVCIEHYTDYGETLAGTDCHDLTRDGVVTAVEEMEEANGHIIIYPNPIERELRVASYELQMDEIAIWDIMGRKVLLQKAENRKQNELDISHLPVGMYFVQLITDRGVITRKVVKK